MNRLFALCLAVGIGLSSAPKRADGTITVRVTGGATPVGSPTIVPGALGAIVTVSAYGNPSGVVIVEADGPNDAIERIRIVPQTNPPFTANQLNLVARRRVRVPHRAGLGVSPLDRRQPVRLAADAPARRPRARRRVPLHGAVGGQPGRRLSRAPTTMARRRADNPPPRLSLLPWWHGRP